MRLKPHLIHVVSPLGRGGLSVWLNDMISYLPEYSHTILSIESPHGVKTDEEAGMVATGLGIDVVYTSMDQVDGYRQRMGAMDYSCMIIYDVKGPLSVTTLKPSIYVGYHHYNKQIQVRRRAVVEFNKGLPPEIAVLGEMVPFHETAGKVRGPRTTPTYSIGMFMGPTDYDEKLLTRFVNEAPEDWTLFVSTLGTYDHAKTIESLKRRFDAGRGYPCRMKGGSILKYLDQVDVCVTPNKGFCSRCDMETVAYMKPLIQMSTVPDTIQQLKDLQLDVAARHQVIRDNSRVVKRHDARFKIVNMKQLLKECLYE